ncbi:bifunctional 6-phosphofructo-2-kinase/fructose-2,6-bisphosphate 2-phosphatase [Rhizoclosmatium globosum]|uniref:Bifunctional 6-phosphofructo-2-kinase/fructose-2,6-bisphosphate 2-phosphatase n=1 Tax=Rhizoclosmatium globosum TaxID=329046 RepID=A0A1Y2CND6_9FUNG|nr:bifunctional 6-phosphofructo-2-kinase/fructose-2,6-bisphosphate 2-phosphatase [Rhizoclosmatium globosum]|eukprot:ORY48558.1 bifunctional 6-phosphofructo-2-kinase/fructose-2,6-bisphosphate 2-phosphatase [Rhizoclosmatium globosum]
MVEREWNGSRSSLVYLQLIPPIPSDLYTKLIVQLKFTDICKKLSKYLSWCGYKTKVFNVGNRRRIHAPPTTNTPTTSDGIAHMTLSSPHISPNSQDSPTFVNPSGTLHDASFFDPKNKEFAACREKLALETLDELLYWLHHEGGKVAIHDATNSTVERRRAVIERVRQEPDTTVVFVESICTEGEVLEQNIRMKLKGPDYVNMPPEEAMADFRARGGGTGISYIKIINVGKKVIAHNIHGYLPSQCVFYLMQIHIKERTLWLSRHGESTYNRVNRIGGDPPLTPMGAKYARAMNAFIQNQVVPPHLDPDVDAEEIELRRKNLHVWTSTLQRALSSVESFEDGNWHTMHFKVLGEIFAGICEDMTYEEIERTYPDIWAARQKNKLLFRYPGPGGESYSDVIERLKPIIVELERMEDDLLIVTHQVVMRTLLAYFCNIPLEEMPTMTVPLHTLYKVTPKPYGAEVQVYQWDAETDEMVLVGGNELLDAWR